jgi:hypothetical protein
MAYYWCLKHNRVETDDNKCSSDNLLGPYETEQDARLGLQRLHERNRKIDAEDAAWTGEEP